MTRSPILRFTFRGVAAVTLVVSVLLLGAGRAGAQTRLTLADALRIAADHSETITIARAGESRADADQQRALSQKLPQVNFNGGYDRTLASQYSGFDSESTGPVCAPLAVDASKPVTDRVSEIERAASCGSLGSGLGFNFSSLPFGQRNIYQYNFGFSQALYAGGRITAQQTQAARSHDSAVLITTAVEAQLAFDVTQAFYDAALSDRLVTIAESAYAQASSAFDQVKLSFDAGRQPEFELLRAQVSRDNQRPVVIRRKADRDIAYLRLRQLLEMPTDLPLSLDLELDGATLPPPAPFVEALATATATPISMTIAADRAPVKQAQALVGVREAGVTIARAERLPSVNLTSAFGQVGYPSSGAFPGTSDFRTNWSLGAVVTVPVFTGYRLRAGELAARADLAEAQARLKQTQELAVLDASTAAKDLEAADAAWQASAGTIQQAERAYQIAELRNREGLSTQLELTDARLALQVAQANRAVAARDLQVARARVALLPNLPLAGR